MTSSASSTPATETPKTNSDSSRRGKGSQSSCWADSRQSRLGKKPCTALNSLNSAKAPGLPALDAAEYEAQLRRHKDERRAELLNQLLGQKQDRENLQREERERDRKDGERFQAQTAQLLAEEQARRHEAVEAARDEIQQRLGLTEQKKVWHNSQVCSEKPAK